MNAVATTIVLVARLLVLGPEGTRLVSEHTARIRPGATGLLRETLAEDRLPGALQLFVTPRRGAEPPPPGGEPPPLAVSLRSEIWASPQGLASGAAPDEINTEEISLSPSGATLTQIAEDTVGQRRLILSLSLAPPNRLEAAVPDTRPPSAPREIALRVEVFYDRAGARELLSQHLLLTLEDLPVTWSTTWKRLGSAEGVAKALPEEKVSLTLRPLLPSGGWISVETNLRATLSPSEEGGEPVSLDRSVVRTVPFGIPFELAVEPPRGARFASADGERGVTYVFSITPSLPAAGPGG